MIRMIALFVALSFSSDLFGAEIIGKDYCENRIGVGNGFVQLPPGSQPFFIHDRGIRFTFAGGEYLSVELNWDPSDRSSTGELRSLGSHQAPIPFDLAVREGARTTFYLGVGSLRKGGQLVVAARSAHAVERVFDSFVMASQFEERCSQ